MSSDSLSGLMVVSQKDFLKGLKKLTLDFLDIDVCALTGISRLQLQGDCDLRRRLVDEAHQCTGRQGYMDGEDPESRKKKREMSCSICALDCSSEFSM